MFATKKNKKSGPWEENCRICRQKRIKKAEPKSPAGLCPPLKEEPIMSLFHSPLFAEHYPLTAARNIDLYYSSVLLVNFKRETFIFVNEKILPF